MAERASGLLIPTAEDVRNYMQMARLRLSHQPAGGSRLALDDVTLYLPNGETDTVPGDYRNTMGVMEMPAPELGSPEAEVLSYKLGLVVGAALVRSGNLLHKGFDAVARDLAAGRIGNDA